MARYINADALMKKLNEDPIGQTIVQRYNIDGFIEAFPTADVVERKKGRWMLGKNMPNYPTVPYFQTTLYCSECRNEAYWDTDYGQQEFDWCPYCGADMRKETEDAVH